MRKKPRIGLFLVCLLLVGAMLAPWNLLAEHQLKRALAKRGMDDIAFRVESIGFKGLRLADLSLGDRLPLTLDRLMVDYSIFDLLQENISRISTEEFTVTQNDIDITVYDAVMDFGAVGEDKREGNWSFGTITVEKAPLPLPPLSAEGTWEVKRKISTIKGTVKSADNSHHAQFTVEYDTDDPERGKLHIEGAQVPWKGGMLSTRDAFISLNKGQSSKIRVRVVKIPLDTLLAGLTHGKARATGTVSGMVPVVLQSGKPPAIESAELEAGEPGKINMSPDAIPASNQGLDILTSVLSDFYYEDLGMEMNGGGDKPLSAKLILFGRNPEFQEGRLVKLNVNLTGDVLELIQQSVFPLADPQQLLKQE